MNKGSNIVHGVIPDLFGNAPHHFTITPDPDNPLKGLLKCECGYTKEVERDEPIEPAKDATFQMYGDDCDEDD